MDLQKVGKFIAEKRKQKELTQEKLGEMLSITGKTISKWERGVNAPDISVLNKLSEILDVEVSDILNGEIIDSTASKSEKTIENIKYYTKIERKKYINIFTKIIVALIMLFAITFTITNYNQFKIYLVECSTEEYFVEGFIVSNQERNLLIIKNIDIKDKYIGTQLEEKVKDITISIISNNKNIFSLAYENDENGKPINEYLLNRTYFSDEDVNANENIISTHIDLKNMKLKIEYTDIQNNTKTILIPLKIEKEYSNNKLVY